VGAIVTIFLETGRDGEAQSDVFAPDGEPDEIARIAQRLLEEAV
jgi:hypothetical protein